MGDALADWLYGQVLEWSVGLLRERGRTSCVERKLAKWPVLKLQVPTTACNVLASASDKTWPRFNRYDAAAMLLADKLDLQNKLKLNMLQVRAVFICLLFFCSKLTPPLVVCAAD